MHGLYYDPKHGGCLRRIWRAGPDTYRIVGVYGSDETPHTHRSWYAQARVVSRSATKWGLVVDFAGKPIKPDRFLTASFEPGKRRIRWEDGNTWQGLFYHASQLQGGTGQ